MMDPRLRGDDEKSLHNNSFVNKKLGFTLIEIMVVLLIISIAATFTVLSLTDFLGSRRAETLANELYNKIRTAQEQAILQPVVMGLTITNNQYLFAHYLIDQNNQSGKWQTIDRDQIFKPQAIPSDVVIRLKVQDNPIDLGNTNKSDTQKTTPQLIFLPSGDSAAFSITIGTEKDPTKFTITGKNNGAIRLQENK